MELTEKDLQIIRREILKTARYSLIVFLIMTLGLMLGFYKPAKSGRSILDLESYGWLWHAILALLIICLILGYINAHVTTKNQIKNDAKFYKKIRSEAIIEDIRNGTNLTLIVNGDLLFDYKLSRNTNQKLKKGSAVIVFYEEYTMTLLDVMPDENQ